MNPQPQLAAPPLARRMACWVYEGILVFAVLLLSTLAFSIAGQMRSGIHWLRPYLIGFLFVTSAMYFVWFWARGQTLAMKTWRIRIVDREGAPVSQPRALLRYVYCSIWFAPVIAAIRAHPGTTPRDATVLLIGWIAVWAVLSRFHPQRQFWHDAWAGTRLIPADKPQSAHVEPA